MEKTPGRFSRNQIGPDEKIRARHQVEKIQKNTQYCRQEREVRQKIMDTERSQRGEKEQGLHLVLLFPSSLRHAESHLAAQ